MGGREPGTRGRVTPVQHEHNSNPPASMSGGLPLFWYLTAAHEAGHAIVGVALGLDVVHVALDDLEATGRYAHTALAGPPVTATTAPAWSAMYVAGHLAEARAAAEIGAPAPDTGTSDHDRIAWEARCAPHGIDLWDSILTATHVLTRCWPDVRKLAHELRHHHRVDVAQWIQENPL